MCSSSCRNVRFFVRYAFFYFLNAVFLRFEVRLYFYAFCSPTFATVVEFAKVPNRPEGPLRAIRSHFAVLMRDLRSTVARRKLCMRTCPSLRQLAQHKSVQIEGMRAVESTVTVILRNTSQSAVAMCYPL